MFSLSDNNEYAKRAMKEHISKRSELKNSYWNHRFILFVNSLCCCFKSCCRRVACYNTRDKRYRKFYVALERLTHEQDIQYVMEMNRVNRLLHKINFLPRQIRALHYSHKFVITDRDLMKTEKAKFDPKN